MARLRDPERGCAWDVAQSSESIVPYTIEEAYEVADAVERGDRADLRDELGDLLLQVVFQARLAEEEGAFRFDDVAEAICAKLIRRHPHVFDASGDFLPPERRPTDPAAIQAAWEAIKARERADKAAAGKGAGKGEAAGPLAGVSRALPALARADRISKRAAAVGFDWPDAAQVLAKVREEVDEVEESLGAGEPEAVFEEIGDLLFSVANLARHAGVDPEEALRRGTLKFERRFTAMADRLAAEGHALQGTPLPAMEAAWQAVKRTEKS
jgi:ATP diphosphatase